jgi:hypothetical protein
MQNKFFGKISDIVVSESNSWKEKVFLTFDMDWACDEVMLETATLLEKANIPSTWFVTHETELLERLRSSHLIELGIHPNFNFLLDGEDKNNSAELRVKQLKKLVPEAKSIRSHSLTQSSRLLDMFIDHGLTHDCNNYIPFDSNIELKPWKIWNGMIKVPHFWEDDLYCLSGSKIKFEKIITERGLKVLDFHPIHVFLNTETMARYENSRIDHHSPEKLSKYRCTEEYGTKDILTDIVNYF